MDKLRERFWSRVERKGDDECWQWNACLCHGYGYFKLCGKMKRAHRVAYVLMHPLTINLLDDLPMCVCHKCDNPKCVNPAHLFLGTHADNNRDRDEKGRGKCTKGEEHTNVKLGEEQVIEIRSIYTLGKMTHRQLAMYYGLSKSAIGHIIRRECWKHI
jgi:hypothetical protein